MHKSLTMRIVFFKRPKPKQFDYKPLYYDEVKEEMEKRMQRIRQAGEERSDEDIKHDLKYEIERNWRRKKQGGLQKVNTIRFLVYFTFALLMIYFIFFTDFINKFLSYFVK
ncbi:MAG: hypothetical protein U9R60_08075 [Bacteroidota bacterium]|nr:hypothetical protein [Bacteroidota bacterium]